ncbi:MAG: hypothetical protein ACTSRZ_03875 [Promethearchaeota archaeon]
MVVYSVPYNLTHKIIAWSCTIVLSIVVGFLLINLSKKNKEKSESLSKIRYFYGIFLIGWGIGRFLFLLSDYALDKEGKSEAYAQFLLIGYLVIIWSFLLLIYTIEKYIKSPPSLTVTKILMVGGFGLIGFWIGVIFDPTIDVYARWFSYIIGGIVGFIIFFYYLILAFRVVGSVRKLALLNLLGISLIFTGHVLDTEYISPFYYPIIWFPPLFSIAGIILFYYVQKITEK